MCSLDYSVAIRTLGQTGEVFYKELKSIFNQTVLPKKVLVYIAKGYSRPKQQIGYEEYIYVDKGMVAQRALPYHEVDSPYLLLLDDDVYLPRDAVENLYISLKNESADCISPDVFRTHELSFVKKTLAYLTNMVFPRFDQKWAFKIHRNISFSYCNKPKRSVLTSQSAAGPASFWCTSSFRNIHFEDEKWMDRFSFAYGDDLLLFYKLHVNKHKLLIHYNSSIVHMDGQSARSKYKSNPNRLKIRSQLVFIIWWRISFNVCGLSFWDKTMACFAYFLKFVHQLFLHVAYSVVSLSIKPVKSYLAGQIAAWHYVHSDEYLKIPNFMLEQKK